MSDNQPAAVLLSFSRVQGSSVLFNSPFDHQGFVMMRVHKCNVEYAEYGDNFFPTDLPYIEVAMSFSQFATAISCMNTQGTPATLKYFNGVEQPKIEHIDRRTKIDEDLKKLSGDIIKDIKTLYDFVGGVKANKAVIHQIQTSLASIQCTLDDHIPFMLSGYAENLNNIEEASKVEIMSYLDMSVRNFGRSQLDKLINMNDLKKEEGYLYREKIDLRDLQESYDNLSIDIDTSD